MRLGYKSRDEVNPRGPGPHAGVCARQAISRQHTGSASEHLVAIRRREGGGKSVVFASSPL